MDACHAEWMNLAAVVFFAAVLLAIVWIAAKLFRPDRRD